jgi:RNA polymerase sigma-70 factor (ECF subfamily)
MHPVLVNGAAGVLVTLRGQPITVMGFAVADGKIVEINAVADPSRIGDITSSWVHISRP